MKGPKLLRLQAKPYDKSLSQIKSHINERTNDAVSAVKSQAIDAYNLHCLTSHIHELDGFITTTLNANKSLNEQVNNELISQIDAEVKVLEQKNKRLEYSIVDSILKGNDKDSIQVKTLNEALEQDQDKALEKALELTPASVDFYKTSVFSLCFVVICAVLDFFSVFFALEYYFTDSIFTVACSAALLAIANNSVAFLIGSIKNKGTKIAATVLLVGILAGVIVLRIGASNSSMISSGFMTSVDSADFFERFAAIFNGLQPTITASISFILGSLSNSADVACYEAAKKHDKNTKKISQCNERINTLKDMENSRYAEAMATASAWQSEGVFKIIKAFISKTKNPELVNMVFEDTARSTEE